MQKSHNFNPKIEQKSIENPPKYLKIAWNYKPQAKLPSKRPSELDFSKNWWFLSSQMKAKLLQNRAQAFQNRARGPPESSPEASKTQFFTGT